MKVNKSVVLLTALCFALLTPFAYARGSVDGPRGSVNGAVTVLHNDDGTVLDWSTVSVGTVAKVICTYQGSVGGQGELKLRFTPMGGSVWTVRLLLRSMNDGDIVERVVGLMQEGTYEFRWHVRSFYCLSDMDIVQVYTIQKCCC